MIVTQFRCCKSRLPAFRVFPGGSASTGSEAGDSGLEHLREVAAGCGLQVTTLEVEAQARLGLCDISLLEVTLQPR